MGLSLKTLLVAGAALVAARPRPPPPSPFFVNHPIYTPPQGVRIMYPRVSELRDGTLLVAANVFGGDFFVGPDGNIPAFPVFESKDGGVTWKWISNITDQVNGWGMNAQPALLELRRPIGGYKPGTVLASGNSWSASGTRIELYASKDKGRSWEYVSRVTEGGRPNTTNGADPVWEPFLLHYEDELIVYYSDQRDPKHGQKLAHQRSKDLKTWGPAVNDVAYYDEYLARPGMTVVAHIPPLKKWIVVYERPIGNSSSHGANYPVHYRLADKPTEFDTGDEFPIVIDGNFAPNASPYVVWTPWGGKNGTIVVSDADNGDVFVNQRGADPAAWKRVKTGQRDAYSRALHVFEKHPERLAIIGGDTFNGSDFELTIGVLDLKKLLGEQKPRPGKPGRD
ncbi:hypothetical protein VTJ83DRAFT_6020 [Remersonia thermophila]|uniref:Glycoside hydrolase family 93 protein n=1 Tax=Remersonia thermophila TaxID=72144 RepID=A0ABR4D8M2_9PEZI